MTIMFTQTINTFVGGRSAVPTYLNPSATGGWYVYGIPGQSDFRINPNTGISETFDYYVIQTGITSFTVEYRDY